jgi:hypothetical protein
MPDSDSVSHVCGWCGVYAAHDQVGPLGNSPVDGGKRVTATYKCSHCDALSVASSMSYGYDERNVFQRMQAGDAHWFPSGAAIKEFPDVPRPIAETATEAYRCLSVGARRGAVVLARTVIEATAKNKGITSGLLHQKIEQLRTSDLIREDIRLAAHEIRLLGNGVAHGDEGEPLPSDADVDASDVPAQFVEPISKEEAEDVLTLMEEVLREVFQSRAVTNRLIARRAQSPNPT